jgi:hypothetical protein
MNRYSNKRRITPIGAAIEPTPTPTPKTITISILAS